MHYLNTFSDVKVQFAKYLAAYLMSGLITLNKDSSLLMKISVIGL